MSREWIVRLAILFVGLVTGFYLRPNPLADITEHEAWVARGLRTSDMLVSDCESGWTVATADPLWNDGVKYRAWSDAACLVAVRGNRVIRVTTEEP